jgi:Zn-dependent peptidase ImmA (M78 family)
VEDLEKVANALGMRIKYTDLGRRHGEVHSSGLVFINDHRPVKAMRITLAHEIGHFVHGHQRADDRCQLERQERQAQTYAARLLISPQEYARAEAVYGEHVNSLAKELNVTPLHIELWRLDYTRAPRRRLRAV